MKVSEESVFARCLERCEEFKENVSCIILTLRVPIRDEAILLVFSPIFLSSNSFYFYLFCSMLQYFAQSLAIILAI